MFNLSRFDYKEDGSVYAELLLLLRHVLECFMSIFEIQDILEEK